MTMYKMFYKCNINLFYVNNRYDPGITSAICFEDGEIKDVIDMPTMASGNKNKSKLMGAKYSMKFLLELKIIKLRM